MVSTKLGWMIVVAKRFKVRIEVTEYGNITSGPGGNICISNGGPPLNIEEDLEAHYLLQALGIVLRRTTEVSQALQAVPPNSHPFRTEG